MIIAKDKEYLLESALWLVFDPWCTQQQIDQDVTGWLLAELTNNDIINNYFAEQIYVYLEQKYSVKHKAIAISEEDIYIHSGIHSLFENWRNLNSVEKIKSYMHQHQLSDIVICGFHHGICTINRPWGAKQMRHHYNVYLKRDITCCLTILNTLKNIESIHKSDTLSEEMFTAII